MKKLQEKIDNLCNADFMDFYEKFKGYKSEQREIIKNEYVDKTFTYSVRFTYTLVDESWLHKGDTAVNVITDPIFFCDIEDAELYIKEAATPIKYHNNSKGYGSKNRYYLELKDNDLIRKLTGNKPEWLIGRLGNSIFGIYDTNDYDKPTFTDFLYNLKLVHKTAFVKSTTTVSTYEIQNLANIEITKDIDNLENGRNSVIVNEIKRTEQYLKFLKALLK